MCFKRKRKIKDTNAGKPSSLESIYAPETWVLICDELISDHEKVAKLADRFTLENFHEMTSNEIYDELRETYNKLGS